MFDAFVLAAGFGTRLRPLTAALPKPLVPVCGVPMLDWAVDALARAGHERILVNAHHAPEPLLAWAASRPGVEVSVEADILGTGGGLRLVRDRLAPRFVVVNGDVLHTVDPRRLLDAVVPGGVALALRRHPDAASYGPVAMDSEGSVVSLRTYEGPTPVGEVTTDSHFTGVWAADRSILDNVPDGFADVAATAWRTLLPTRRLRGVLTEGPWLDVGDPRGWWLANLAVLRGEVDLGVDPFRRADAGQTASGGGKGSRPPGVQMHGAVWIGEGARIAPGAVLRDVVIGPGAVVGSTQIERSVVWASAVVEEPLCDGAIGPSGERLAFGSERDIGP